MIGTDDEYERTETSDAPVAAGAWNLQRLIEADNCEFSQRSPEEEDDYWREDQLWSHAQDGQLCYATDSQDPQAPSTCFAEIDTLMCHIELPAGLGIDSRGPGQVQAELTARCPELGIDLWQSLYV